MTKIIEMDNETTATLPEYPNADIPIPWLKIIGNAYIAWIREQHPESFPE